MSIYNDFDACSEFCIILLYILPYVHTLFDKFIVFSTIVYFFSKNMYLILNRH